jgi:F-box protein 11
VFLKFANASTSWPTTVNYGMQKYFILFIQTIRDLIIYICYCRKTIFQRLFEYDLPMFRHGSGIFEVVPLDESDYENPWKVSLKQLYKGIHVRESYKDMYVDNLSGRNIVCVDSIAAALSVGGDNPLIFVHANKYVGESLVIDNNAEIIGAAPGNISDNVLFDTDRDSTVVFVEGAVNSYLGYVTIKFSPDSGASNVAHQRHYCLDIKENCSPTVDHCVIKSLSTG